jgi:uncharacterized protein YqgC (DUF456 family)
MVLPLWALGLAVVLLIIGLLGIVLPGVPGVGLMWVVILLYAIAERFAAIDPISFAVLTVLGLAGATADLWLGYLGAKVAGASLRSTLYGMGGAFLGGTIGFLFAGVGAIPGVLVGSILGVWISEYVERKDWKAALQATMGMMLGFTVSTVVQGILGLMMLAIFCWQVLRG